MSIKNKDSFLGSFLKSKNVSPFIAALASGLYPFLFYYSNNYTLIGSWEHMSIFFTIFIVAPLLIFWAASRVVRLPVFHKLQPVLLPFLNVFFFLFFIIMTMYSGNRWIIVLGVLAITSIVIAFFRRFFKKWIVMQFVFACIGFISFVPKVIYQINYSKEWLEQPDDILEATFKETPNIYLIQPDGYVNFSELKKGYYNFDNSDFESFLEQHNFKSYANFRSNYAATLATNSSLFAMKHHYYNDGASFSETIDARNVIISDNSVLAILKNNGYQTSFYSEHPYFFTNKPKLGYDKSNFTKDDVSIITTGMTLKRDVIDNFKNDSIIKEVPTFTFIQIFNPTHITRSNHDTSGVSGEKKKYLEGIKTANTKLEQLITIIGERDPGAMILIMADHGGFVGYEHTGQSYKFTENITLRQSIFSAIFTVKWPNNKEPSFNDKLKSPVNLFRILIAYLSEEPKYLDNLQDDGSYIIIKEGAPKGIYKYLDDNGAATFKKR